MKIAIIHAEEELKTGMHVNLNYLQNMLPDIIPEMTREKDTGRGYPTSLIITRISLMKFFVPAAADVQEDARF
jgi:hypothetical protein